MSTASAYEFRSFTISQRDLNNAIRSKQYRLARTCLAEIETLWVYTTWPRLRDACAALMRQHANHGDFSDFIA